MLNYLNQVFLEIFEGRQTGAVFLDDDAPALLELLSRLNAGQASQPVCGASVAAHGRHILFSIGAYQKALESSDNSYITDGWPEWGNVTVSETQWSELILALRTAAAEFAGLTGRIGRQGALNGTQKLLLMGALAHMAFHLGAVQVKFDRLANIHHDGEKGAQ